MGGKYEVRYAKGEYWDEQYTNNFWEFLELLWIHKGKIIYFRVFCRD
jgi:hypothetical protein